MPSEDKTYCGYTKCPHLDCERHPTRATGLYNRFAYFHDCDKYPPTEFSKEEQQDLKMKILGNTAQNIYET